MKRLYAAAIVAAILSVILTSCQTAPVIQQESDSNTPSTSPLDGTWVVVTYECEQGKLNKTGKEVNEGIVNGEPMVTTIRGEKVATDFNTGHCDYAISERWVITPPATLTVSDTTSQLTVRQGEEKAPACKPYELKTPRTHHFSLEGNLLKIALTTQHSLGGNQNLGKMCDRGREVIVYARQRQ